MSNSLKLRTVGILFALILVVTGTGLFAGMMVVERNVASIRTTWDEFQVIRSEKARLESVLRAAIGYGGMIHEFKNYVLRGGDDRADRVQAHLGAAKAVIDQYNTLSTTTAETVALDDILQMLLEYERSLTTALVMKGQGKSVVEIDKAVKVDDTAALRGLITLRQEVEAQLGAMGEVNKGRLAATLRGTLGYGGVIHSFKNLVLRGDTTKAEKVKAGLKAAKQALDQYSKLGVGTAEQLAIDDILATLLDYEEALAIAVGLVNQNKSPVEIDAKVMVDDTKALRGLKVLDREIATQVAARSDQVERSFVFVTNLVDGIRWGAIVLISGLLFGAYFLLIGQVIKPLRRLTRTMNNLADNDLEARAEGANPTTEIGQMACAVNIFRENAIKRREAEEELSFANDAMNSQLAEIQDFRERAEEQAAKAVSLAEGLAAARESTELALKKAENDEQRISSILNTVSEAIITIDEKGFVESFNRAAEDIFGYRAAEVEGRNVTMLMPEAIRAHHDEYVARFLEHGPARKPGAAVEMNGLRQDGTIFPIELDVSRFKLGDKVRITGVVRDITERKRAEEEIRRLAMTDPLTGLANRNQFNKNLADALHMAERLKRGVGLMMLDLDKFKPVNDTHGHPMGDALLCHVAEILKTACREVDTVARLGGDEFAIILNGIDDRSNETIPAQRLVDELCRPVEIKGTTLKIGTSIGISFYPEDSTDPESLLKMADLALYQAKKGGRNTFRFYEAGMAD